MAQVVFYCRKVSEGDIMDENFEKCQKEVIKEFIRRHWKLIRIIMVMLLLFFRFSPKLDKITKPKDTPVAVTVELSGKEDGGYQGYSFYLDNKQPMMGLIEGGIIYRTIPIEQEDYDSMMNVGYGKYSDRDVTVDGSVVTYYKITLTDASGKEKFVNGKAAPALLSSLYYKIGVLTDRYIN